MKTDHHKEDTIFAPDKTHHIRKTMFPRWLSLSLKVVFTPLYINAFAVWLASVTVLFHDNWKCIPCRHDKHTDPSILPTFLFYSAWNALFAAAVFVHWAYFPPTPRTAHPEEIHHKEHDKDKTLANEEETHHDTEDAADTNVPSNGEDDEDQETTATVPGNNLTFLSTILFPLALPVVTAVFGSYVLYVVRNPMDSFVDEDVCERCVRSKISKDIAESHPFAANLYMFLHFLMDVTIHYLSAPLLVSLYVSCEIPYLDNPFRPLAPIFTLILSLVIGIVHDHVVPVYCTDTIWVTVVGFLVAVCVFHALFSLGSRGRLFRKTWPCVVVNNTKPIHPQSTEDTRHGGDNEQGDET